jgi:flagellar biosynthesis/type III secretory pathway protein FliH
VVIRELPSTRETLLLRLMGAASVLRQAVAELLALPDAAPERTLALPLLVSLRLEIAEDPAQRTSDDVEFLMSTHDIVEAWKQQWLEEGMRKGIERGIAQGIAQGVAQGVERGIVRTLVDVYEARFGAIPAELRAALERTHDEATLRGFSKLFGVGTASEITEALRNPS